MSNNAFKVTLHNEMYPKGKILHTFKQFLLYLNGTNGLPNITHFREIYDSDGNFLILEYPKIKGQSLGDALDNGIKSVDEIKQFLMVLLRASEIVKIIHSPSKYQK